MLPPLCSGCYRGFIGTCLLYGPHLLRTRFTREFHGYSMSMFHESFTSYMGILRLSSLFIKSSWISALAFLLLFVRMFISGLNCILCPILKLKTTCWAYWSFRDCVIPAYDEPSASQSGSIACGFVCLLETHLYMYVVD